MKKTLFFVGAGLALWLLCSECRSIRRNSGSAPVSHKIWDQLVRKHVDERGFVDYKSFIQDSSALNQYLDLLSSAHPDAESWSREEQMAYWINAYNAFTVKLILQHYPVPSIKDIRRGIAFVNSVWDIQWIKIGEYTYDLNNIEHNILRPVFKDARIHAAINCASFSCPKLRREAYTAEKLDQQLDEAMRDFLADPLRNRIGAESIEISEIFKWFKGDFQRDAGSLRAYLERFSGQKIPAEQDIGYLNYDWRLNDTENSP